MTATARPGDLLADAWAALVGDGGTIRPAPPLEVTGPSGLLPSAFAVEQTAVACVGAALMAAATVDAGDDAPRAAGLGLDRAHVAAAVLSERHFRVAGRAAGVGFAPLSRFWPTADGFVRTHANYPWHRAALLGALGTDDDPDAVAAALSALPSAEVENRVVAAGGVAAAVRTLDEWRAHPQGVALASEPLIGHLRLGDAPPRRRPARRAGGAGDAHCPAAGIRVLDLTRVIAGPVCTRYLGALGADVLRIDPPARPDMAPGTRADTLLAKRSAALDLAGPAGLPALHDLLDRADVVVCGYRPGSLEAFGLGADDLAVRHPGLVVVYLAAWGHTGPWRLRRGFDSVVQAPTGIAAAESGDGVTPGALPCQLLDHGTGYLAAAAVLDGLRRQSSEGGTHVRRLSLARTAGWLTATPPAGLIDSGGVIDAGAATGAAGAPTTGASPPPPWIVSLDGPGASVEAVAPPGTLGARSLRWPGPPAAYRSDPPAWAS